LPEWQCTRLKEMTGNELFRIFSFIHFWVAVAFNKCITKHESSADKEEKEKEKIFD
jgi:hypothetical protein